MKRKNKFIWLASTLASIVAVGGLVACKDHEESSSNYTPPEMSTPDNNTPTVTILQTNLKMDTYSTSTLTAKVENLEGDVVWTSSDENVAIVNANGAVTAKKAGVVTVTAKVGDYSDTCEITVADGTKELEFSDVRDFSLVAGKQQQLDKTLIYEGNVFPFTEVTFSAESGKDILSVTEDGLVIAGNTLGTQKITATATMNGKEVAKKEITVTVYVYEYGTINTGATNNKVTLLQTDNFGGKTKTYALDNVKAYINAVEQTNVTFEYEIIAGEDVISFEDGLITSVASGEATLQISFTSEKGVSYYTMLTVEVLDLDKKGNQYFVMDNTKYVPWDSAMPIENGKMVVDVSTFDFLPTDLQNVTINGNNTNYSFLTDDVMILNNNSVGELTVEFETLNDVYTFEMLSADVVIDSFADYRYYMTGRTDGQSVGYNITKTRETAMYALMTTDIVSEGGTGIAYQCNNSMPTPKGSVFDGNGYTLSNVYCSFGWYGATTVENATIKNLTMDNFIIYQYSIFGNYFVQCNFENLKVIAKPYAYGNNAFYGNEDNPNFNGGNWLFVRSLASTIRDSEFVLWNTPGYQDKAMALMNDENSSMTLTNVNIYTDSPIALPGEKTHYGVDVGRNTITNDSTYTVYDADTFKANQSEDFVLTNDGKTMQKDALGDIGTIRKVIVDGSLLSFTDDGDTLTFNKTVGGEKRYVITDKGAYLDTTILYDLEISNRLEFKRWYYLNADKYNCVILTNDVDVGYFSKYYVWWYEDELDGKRVTDQVRIKDNLIFNGMGHKVSNLFGRYGLLNHAGVSGVTIKNVTFDNFYFRHYGVLGGGANYGTTLENVTVNAVASANYAPNASRYAMETYSTLLMVHVNDLTLKNCKINVDWSEAEYCDKKFRLTRSVGNLTLIDTTITSNSYIGKPGETVTAEDCNNDSFLEVTVTITDKSSNYSIKDRDDA